MKIIVLDIGGTYIKYGIYEDKNVNSGQFLVAKDNIPEKLLSFVRQCSADIVAISVPGPFDYHTGTSFMTHKLLSMYKINLKEVFEKNFPCAKVFFLHDSVAYAIGVMKNNLDLMDKCFAGIMLGTGLGYVFAEKGKILLNEQETPLHPLWNRAFRNGIAEDYVSTRAIISSSEKYGFYANNIRDIANAARGQHEELKKVFFDYGEALGMCVNDAYKIDSFTEVVIGGQISRSWDIIKPGFESVCNFNYRIVDDPSMCALEGLYECAVKGKENYYKICKE